MRRNCKLALPSWLLGLELIIYNNNHNINSPSILQKDCSNYIIGCSRRSYGNARGDFWANNANYHSEYYIITESTFRTCCQGIRLCRNGSVLNGNFLTAGFKYIITMLQCTFSSTSYLQPNLQ